MADQNKTKVPLVTTGGVAPYTYTIPLADPLTTLPLQPGDPLGAGYTIDTVSSTLELDATTVAPGTYSLNVRSTDSTGRSSTKVISIKILDSKKFSILTESIVITPSTFPHVGSLALRYSGASGAVTWSLMPSATSLAGATVTNGYLNFTTNQFGVFTVGLQARDSFKTITKIINISMLPQSAYRLVNGQVEVDFRDNGFSSGMHTFTLTVGDSNAASVTRTFEFQLQPAISPIKIPASAVKYWYTADANAIYLPISGRVSGLSIQDSSGVFDNGVSYNIEGLSSRIKFSGPPTSAKNSELEVPIHLQLGGSVVASVSKTFTIPAFGGVADQSEFYEVCNARPTLVGEPFTLNAQKPYFNSPSIERSRSWKARVMAGNTLPPGLSLDEGTGLIYGQILNDSVLSSSLEFTNELGQVKGTTLVNFTVLPSAFTLKDESLTPASVSFDYRGLIATTSALDLAAIEVVHGALPSGLTTSVTRELTTGTVTFNSTLSSITRTSGSWITDGLTVGSVVVTSGFAVAGNNKALTVQTITDSIITTLESLTSATAVSGVTTCTTKGVIQGTPTEAGFFDVWIKVTSVTGTYAHIYKRLEVNYVTPLAVITSELPLLTNVAYSFSLNAVGGRGNYVWSLDSTSPVLPTGVTLSSAGLLSGTYAGSTYTADIVVRVADAYGAAATKVLPLTFNNTLTIVTATLPQIVKGEFYSFTLKATGGSEDYTDWSVTSGTLPTGLAINHATGTIYGLVDPAASLTPVSIGITVTDSLANVGSRSFQAKVVNALSGLGIKIDNLGVISRGGPYHGTLETIIGTSGAIGPFSWEVMASSPNPLPSGLSLAAVTNPTPALSGTLAVIAGKCTATLTNWSVKVRVVDANGLSATAFLLFNSEKSVKITSNSIPQGRSGSPYSQAVLGESYNTPIVFSLDGGSPALPATFALSSSGVLTGNPSPSATSSTNLIIKLTDAIGDTDVKTLNLTVKTSDLVITTTSIGSIPRGRSWTHTLTATGGSGVYQWSVAPASANKLQDNLQLSTSTGVLATTGTTELSTRDITFRVTDSLGTVTDKVLTLTVSPLETVKAGPDFVHNTAHGYIGHIARGDTGLTSLISPRPSRSFYIALLDSDVTALSQVSVSASSRVYRVSAVPESLAGGVVWINVSFTGMAGSIPADVGDHYVTLNIQSGTNTFSVTMKYKVVEPKRIGLNQGNGSPLPTI